MSSRVLHRRHWSLANCSGEGGRGAYQIIPLELSVAASEPYRVREQVLPPITPCPTASNDTTSVFGVFIYFFFIVPLKSTPNTYKGEYDDG